MQIAAGETRPITEFDVNGSFLCPWCHYPQPADAEQCTNPACGAHKYATAEQVRADQAERARREQEEAERRAKREWFAQYQREQAEKDHALWRELVAKAEDQDKCLVCLRKSAWRSGRPRFIRHRKPDVHGVNNVRR